MIRSLHDESCSTVALTAHPPLFPRPVAALPSAHPRSVTPHSYFLKHPKVKSFFCGGRSEVTA
ncbi:hypothetical protein E2C01_041195 [Portunus trituberculatus]|uniref:Uncharacterized protein n=1 Tax=Portunus trituberculatus TaxID=210409 RepID=A0A5B7FR94_PORTR|nr:hypothetical protein [Portunus trituberculatus]